MKRLPAEFTMIEPGRLRSARQNHGPLGSGIVGPHQASSSRSVAAPTAMPASSAAPVLLAELVLRASLVGCGRMLYGVLSCITHWSLKVMSSDGVQHGRR